MAPGVNPRRIAGRAGPALALAIAAVAAASAPAPPLTIVDLQPLRTEASVAVEGADGRAGTATLTNLNPNVGAWYLLALDFGSGAPRATYHLQRVQRGAPLTLAAGPRGQLLLGFGDRTAACALQFGGPGAASLAAARAAGLPFAPLCDGRLYLRNTGIGRASMLERVTGFLRDHVWGGEQIVTFVKKEIYRDAFREQGQTLPLAADAPPDPAAPDDALVDATDAALAVEPPHLGLDLGGSRALRLGRWYPLRGVPDVYFSTLMPGAIARGVLYGHEASVNPLTGRESSALVYLIAFDLARFDLRFALGTDHPRLGWSPHTLPQSLDPALPGPDGIDSPAPLAITGMVPPADAPRTVAAFAGGFKREHGVFSAGRLATVNHGSHYGFMEEGVVFSRLQPGLATVYTTTGGEVVLGTWREADEARLPAIVDARQNGVPIIEYDARRHASVPGALVNIWGEGNWSGSANEDLRTVRAGLCVQEAGGRRFLIYAYFSSASPSAMARVFQAYRCRYAMHLDMNALEHTYLGLYAAEGGRRTVEHLIDGMDVLDRHSGDALAPRFLGFPDNRDFFYLVRRAAP